MKTYNYYIEGLDNRNNFKSHYIEHVNKRKVIKHLINWYRNQKIKDQGFPSKEKRNCGSKANRSLPTDKSNIVAGFPKVNIGNIEIPLFVTLAAPEI